MPKMSIVVPVYKVERYLPFCVKSLTEQSLEDIEIILVDDGSPDGCGKMCDDYAVKDSRIRVIHKKNGGVSAARNDGLKSATGDWVIFCDSDDYMDKDACKVLYEKGEASNADVVIGDVTQVFDDREEPTVFFKEEFAISDKKFLEELVATAFYKSYCPMIPESGPAFGYGGPWNKAVRREFLTKNSITFDTSVFGIYDDILYTATLFSCAHIVSYVRKTVYYYRILSTSITHTYKSNLLEINRAIFKSCQRIVEKHKNVTNIRDAYYATVIRRLEATFGLYFFNKKNPKSLITQLKELRQLLDTEPYCTACIKADTKKLIKRQRLIAKMASKKNVWGLYLLYRVKNRK